jgi:hypothetical protein
VRLQCLLVAFKCAVGQLGIAGAAITAGTLMSRAATEDVHDAANGFNSGEHK